MNVTNGGNGNLSLQNLPQEILHQILLLVNVKALLHLRCVNKLFCSLVDTHLKRCILFLPHLKERFADYGMQILSPDADSGSVVEKLFPETSFFNEFTHSTRIYGFCNGLICLILDMDRLAVLNPSTNDFKILPKPSNPFHGGVFYGMGYYDSSVDDYKLVRAAASRFRDNEDGLVHINSPIKFEVFTGKSNTWRRTRDIGILKCFIQKQAVHLRGCLHWLKQISTTLYEAYAAYTSLVILRFDLANDDIREICLPIQGHLDIKQSRLGVLGGRLCVCSYGVTDVKIWMVTLNGMARWSRVISLTKPTSSFYAVPICVSRKGEIITIADGRDLVMYNSEGNSYRKIAVGENSHNAAFFVQSLDRPNPDMS